MAERLKAVVLKTTVGATSPGVRIPLPTPGLIIEYADGGRASVKTGEVPEYG